MPRGQEKSIVGGQIDPYVQTSMQQNKQQAENRLVTAIQQAGATERTAMQERGAGERASLQAQTQREGMAAQAESDDKRAAEAEKARRDDQIFTKTMAGMSYEFQAKQADLNRQHDIAAKERDWVRVDEIEKRQESLRRFDTEMRMDAQQRTSNTMLSIIKGSLKRESAVEKTKTALMEQNDKFDRDKGVYNKALERMRDSINYDKRMDLPARKPRPAFRGAGAGMSFPMPQEAMENVADPMGVLQDLINKHGGNMSVEDLSPEKIHKIEAQIQEGKVKTTDVSGTLGALEGMLDAVKERRGSFAKRSDDFEFWEEQYSNMSKMRDALEGLANSTQKKIMGSASETVGSRMEYTLGTINNRSLGGQVSRYKALMGGDMNAVLEEMSKPIDPYKPYEISGDMNEYDIEIRDWYNNYLSSRQTDTGGQE